jgi:hypothetical protein
MQQLAVFILFHCKITLHISGALCTHHQEYIKLLLQPLVQVIMCLGDVVGNIRHKVVIDWVVTSLQRGQVRT